MLHERRKSKRFDIFHILEIKSNLPILGVIKNFSYQGFNFELDSIDFKQKENIEFKLKHPQSNLSLSFLGDVVWEKQVSNTFVAGIKLRKMDKEIKDNLIEILCAIRAMPIDMFNHGKNSKILMRERNEEKSVTKLRETLISEPSKNFKRKLMRNFIIGLSISFFILSIIITMKALNIPVKNIDNRRYSKGIKSEVGLPGEDQQKNHEQEAVTKKYKETIQEIETQKKEIALLPEVKDTQKGKEYNATLRATDRDERGVGTKNHRLQEQEDKHIDNSKKISGAIIADDQIVSQEIYSIQIGSFNSVSEAQQQYDLIVQGLSKEELDYLRIEKVGKYYTVRLGKYEKYAAAEKYLETIKPRISNSNIVSAYIKEKRIIKLFSNE